MNSNVFLPRAGYVCRTCSLSIRQPARQRRIWTASPPLSRQAILPRTPNVVGWRSISIVAAPPGASEKSKSQSKGQSKGQSKSKSKGKDKSKDKGFYENEWTIYSADNAQLVRKAQTFGDQVLNSKEIPTEELTMKAIKVIEFAASQLMRPTPQLPPTPLNEDETTVQPAEGLEGGILSLDKKSAHPMSVSISIDLLSTLAYKIINHPPVFITAPMLESYITTQSLLQRPQSFPEVFHLYATKPAPIPDSAPIRYKTPSQNASTQAVPKPAADKALDAAIASKDLSLALGIIDTTFALPAFHRNKFLKNAAPGLTVLGLAPFAAMALSSQLPLYTNVADPTQLTYIAFASILTYVAAASTLGFVAITTRNDQMERVTWVTGTPLRVRWVREEERAAMDKVAMAWGFKDVGRRGEEEGDEWEILKVECGVRGMVLDRVELMDGME